jgi:hypothetical protein
VPGWRLSLVFPIDFWETVAQETNRYGFGDWVHNPSKTLPMKKGWCKVCENRLKEERYKNKTVEDLRKMKSSDGGKLMGSTSKGCPLCNNGKGVKVCQKCWKTYTPDL